MDCLACCHLLKRACCVSEKHLNKALADLDINLSQGMLLLCIADGDVTSMSNLSKSLCCHKSNITQIVEHLMKEKLIAKVSSKEDRRVQYVKLTEKGNALVRKIEDAVAQHSKICTPGLSQADAKKLASILNVYIAKTEQMSEIGD